MDNNNYDNLQFYLEIDGPDGEPQYVPIAYNPNLVILGGDQ